jgi:hypothetical protein
MIKKLALLSAILLLGALPAAAQSPCDSGGDLAWLLEPTPEPADTAGDTGDDLAWLLEPEPAAVSTARKPRKPTGSLKAMCSEDCNELPDISCSGQSCSAISRDCSIGICERGSVTCDGNTTSCSQACPPNCTLSACKQPCQQPGCVAVCLDRCNCTCETICG